MRAKSSESEFVKGVGSHSSDDWVRVVNIHLRSMMATATTQIVATNLFENYDPALGRAVVAMSNAADSPDGGSE